MPRNFCVLHFRLKEGITKAQFLEVHERFNRDFMSKQKGYLGQNLYLDDGVWRRERDKWRDLIDWEKEEDIVNIFKDTYEHPAVAEYLSLVEPLGPGEKVSLQMGRIQCY